MAKLSLAKLCILLALVAMAEASIYRSSYDRSREDEPSCEEEIRKQELGSCQKLLKYRTSEITMVSKRMNDDEEESRNECCAYLSGVSRDCRCKVVKEVVQGQGAQMETYVKEAENLPAVCGVRPYYCYISASGGRGY